MLMVRLVSIVPLCFLLYILCSYLRHAFLAHRKGLPPYIGTFRSERKLILEKLKLHTGSSMLDLGCGDGGMLRFFVRNFGIKKAVGVDINGFAIRRGRMMNVLNRFFSLGDASLVHIKLIEGDIYKTNVSGYDYMYLYLYPDFVAKLEPRLFEHIDAGTVVICNTFHFVHHEPYEIIRNKKGKEKFFLYKKISTL